MMISRFVYILRQCCLLISIGVFCGGSSAAEGASNAPSPHAIDIPAWFNESFLDIREDIQDAARQSKRLLLYFGQDGCPYCRTLMTVNFSQRDIVAKTRQNFVPVALNIWGDREVTWIDGRRMTEKELARVLNVQFTPTLLFFGEDANPVLRLNGYSPPDKFRVALEYVSRRHEKTMPFTDFIARKTAGKAAARIATEPFIQPGPADLPRMIKSSKPVIVLFEQTSCRECDEMHREAFQRDEVRQLLQQFSVVQADIAGKRKVVDGDGKRLSEREWARKLAVTYAPSLIFFDNTGKEVFRADGYLRPFHFASALDYVASGGYRDEPNFQRYIQKRGDGLRATGKPVDLWE